MKEALPKFVGERVRRREDPDLVRGRGKFVADVELPGAGAMAFVRSPYAHATVKGIDTSVAEAMPGVHLVLTGAELRPAMATSLPAIVGSEGFEFTINPERYPLAVDRVRHAGEAVAVVVADDPYLAVDAVHAVDVDYDDLPAVADVDAALADGAPQLYDAAAGNRGLVWKIDSGGVDEAFADAAVVVELDTRIQRLLPTAMEPRAVAARHDAKDDVTTVWTTTQIPHMVRDAVAAALELEPEKVRTIAPEVGGGFGAKANVYGEEILAAYLARKLARPVRWVATRGEDYVATVHGRDQRDRLRLAADRDGKVLAADLEILSNCGSAYSRVSAVIPPLTGQMITGVYDIPRARARAVGVFTNKPPIEPYRGAGRPEACYLIERGMDLLARELDMDPAELRRRNFIPPDRFPYETATGLTFDSGEYRRALDRLLEHASRDELLREQARRRTDGGKLLGIGIACYVEICGFGPFETGKVQVHADGTATVLTGTSPHGQGHETTFAQIVADTLQLPLDAVTVKHGDTGVIPVGIGTFGSRSAAVGGSAVLTNSRTVLEQARHIAARLLEASEDDVVLGEGRFHPKGAPGRGVTWPQVVDAADADQLSADAAFEPPDETYPFGAHLSLVEIDPETGHVELLRHVTVDDCGKVINPLLVEGQVHGGIAQGVGQALWEEAVHDEHGHLLTGSLMDYALPRIDRLPSYETYRTETPSPLNPLGVKGIGEAATIGSTPAVVNAVVDALAHLGVTHVDMPLTAEKIWRLMRSASP